VNSEIDDVIREAVREQERLAAPADRVRAALPTRAASYARRRRATVGLTAMAAAAAAVAVAVAVPTVLREPAGGGGVAAPPTAASTEDPAADPGLGSVPLRFAPTWLPAGMVERSRFVPVTGTPATKSGMVRVWSREPLDQESGFVADDAHVGLYASRARPDPGADHAPPVAVDENGQRIRGGGTVAEVDVDGRPGRYYDGMVTWQIDEKTQLMLVAPGVGLSKEDLLRIARSVRPDSTALRSPLRLGWLPDGFVEQDLTVAGNSATEWEARMVAERKATPDEPAKGFVSVELGPRNGDDPSSGERFEIDGRPARLTQVDIELTTRPGYRARWALVVDLDSGRRLTVFGGVGPHAGQAPVPTREDVIRVAEHVELAEPDLTWFAG
jgi:hypothetical protein